METLAPRKAMNATKEHPWHSQTVQELAQSLNSDIEKGISSDEIPERQKMYGTNELTAKQTDSVWKLIWQQFNQPLIYILVIASVITFFFKEYVDSAVIMAIVIVNAVIGFIQESKAQKALEALSNTMQTYAMVIRDGKRKEIPAKEIVVGDLVFVQSGDKVPADIRLVSVKEMQVAESALTGESVPVSKSLEVLENDTVLGDRLNMAFASTYVTFGQGMGLVTAVGDQTEVGHISGLISNVESAETPLNQKINQLSKYIVYVILAMSVLTFALGIYRGQDPIEVFMSVVALAVGAIPEGLPAAITTILAIGVSRMAKRHAITRKLPVVETLGSATVICSDKTGTLTENQMTVKEVFAGSQMFEVSGTGYSPEGEIKQNDQVIDKENYPALKDLLVAGLLCNTSEISREENQYLVKGDPTEGALIVAAQKAGLSRSNLLKIFHQLDNIPFESERQYMATLFKLEGQQKNTVYLKGSVEKILEKCSHFQNDKGEIVPLPGVEEIHKKVELMASEGLRVLAFAKKEIDSKKVTEQDLENDNVFIGLQAMIDPPRQEAIKAVADCKKAGIQVKMITGDHGLTAVAIAKQLGIELGAGKKNYTGKELARLSEKEFQEAAINTNVFARVSPEQKLRLVEALQKNNEVVAMTGDGVNDAPALKQAAIGIAMGITGTEVSKEAADMVLTDDNFRSIRDAVEEGRGVFDNIMKFIVWTLPTNMGEGLIILIAALFGIALPITPLQILWINMTTAGFLGLMLAFEPKEPGIMSRKPRKPGQSIFGKDVVVKLILVSLALVVASFGFFQYELAMGTSVEVARTIAVTTFVVLEGFYLLNCRSLSLPMHKIGFFSNLWVWFGFVLMFVFQAFFIYNSWMNEIFGSAPITLAMWGKIMVAGLITYIIIEIEKAIHLKMLKKVDG
ncbi:cation-translocating P-type ATPase [Flexithrix dorotheae]|uniref:cation-translocating P-type ATPase n=1 Tax=Flexithrix dorotheae TaxID=70993 RepID=UPI00037497E2|nr:cation-transporting P-type ATPase [Flexithrix dorotheae]